MPNSSAKAIGNTNRRCKSLNLSEVPADNWKDSIPSPQAFVVHGLEATGKTTVLRRFLDDTDSSFSWVPCNECITARHLTERIAATVSEAFGNVESHPRCENISVLAVYLQRLLGTSERKHFLVLDRIDRQRDAPATLLASLKRLSEMVDLYTLFLKSEC